RVIPLLRHAAAGHIAMVSPMAGTPAMLPRRSHEAATEPYGDDCPTRQRRLLWGEGPCGYPTLGLGPRDRALCRRQLICAASWLVAEPMIPTWLAATLLWSGT